MLQKKYIIIAAVAILAVQALVLFALGQPAICSCGQVKLWYDMVRGPENSQHLFDWYSFSHIIYGFVFYFAFWLLRKKFGWSLAVVFLVALVISMGWEIFENTHYVIDRYRQSPISSDYYGDSVVNSLVDTLLIALGFWAAASFPVWAIVVMAILMEIASFLKIHDNLVLNTLMFIYPVKSIFNWQANLTR